MALPCKAQIKIYLSLWCLYMVNVAVHGVNLGVSLHHLYVVNFSVTLSL